MTQQFCQSCGMPLTDEKLVGNEKDGSKNTEYCVYCYDHGEFTQPELTLEQMVEICVPHMKDHGMTEVAARTLIKEHLPKLKRWQKL